MTTMRLLTWNTWGKNADWQAREDALLAAMADADADIVTVQEAWTEPSGSTQTARLAAALGFAHHHQADPPQPVRDRGLGVLARWPITRHDTIALTAGGEPDEHRIALLATIATPAGNLPLLTTHLNWRPDHSAVRQQQARQLIEAGLGAWNFSVDTLDPALYDRLRGIRGALPVIMKAIETVQAAGAAFPGFRVNCMTVITRHSFRGLPGLLAHCLDAGMASMYLMNVYGDTTGESLLSESEIGEFRDDVVPQMLAVLAGRDAPPVVQANAAQVLGSFFSPDVLDAAYAAGTYWPDLAAARAACRIPGYYALVEPDGRTLPCCQVEISHEGEIGSVAGQSLAEVWAGEAAEGFRRDRIAFCQLCPAPRNRTLGLVPHMCRQFRD